jgi:hypothetical protein
VDRSGLDEASAVQCADAATVDLDDDPVAAADEEMSYWGE